MGWLLLYANSIHKFDVNGAGRSPVCLAAGRRGNWITVWTSLAAVRMCSTSKPCHRTLVSTTLATRHLGFQTLAQVSDRKASQSTGRLRRRLAGHVGIPALLFRTARLADRCGLESPSFCESRFRTRPPLRSWGGALGGGGGAFREGPQGGGFGKDPGWCTKNDILWYTTIITTMMYYITLHYNIKYYMWIHGGREEGVLGFVEGWGSLDRSSMASSGGLYIIILI